MRLRDDSLVPVSVSLVPESSMPPFAVDQYYRFLNDREFTSAWQMLDSTWSATISRDSWLDDVQSITQITPTTDTLRPDGRIHVSLIRYDRISQGSESSREYEGTWGVRWTDSRGWVLYDPQFTAGESGFRTR